MKRRNFLKTLIGAAAAVALPASAMRDVLIHRGNPMTHDGTHFKVLFNSRGRMPLYYYQRDALRQMNFYQHGARIHMAVERGFGKTILHTMNYADIEKRVIAILDKKSIALIEDTLTGQLKMLDDFEAAESWRGILPKQKRA